MINPSAVLYTDTKARMNQNGNLTAGIDDGEPFVQDLKAAVFEGKGSGGICFSCMLYTKDGIQIQILCGRYKNRFCFRFNSKPLVEKFPVLCFQKTVCF